MTFMIPLQPIEGAIPRSNQIDRFHRRLRRELRHTAATIELRGGTKLSVFVTVNYTKLVKKFESPAMLRKAIVHASDGAYVAPGTLEFEVSKPVPFSKRGEGQPSVEYTRLRVDMCDDTGWPSTIS